MTTREKLGDERYEKQLEANRRWKAANREAVKAASARYYRRNRSKASEYGEQWRAAHPDYYRTYRQRQQ